MTWFYTMSHLVMTLNALRRPPSLAHEEILENGKARDNHVVDVSPICQNIMWIKRGGLESKLFERDNNDLVALARSILTKV